MGGIIKAAQIQQDYFKYLCSLVNADDPSCTFSKLMMSLHICEFTWRVSNDVNRAEDGLSLRIDFSNIERFDEDTITWLYSYTPCSVLEMMIALAFRIDEDIMWNPDKGSRTIQWFWEMIHNLNLESLSDENWVYPESDFVVKASIGKLLDRDFDKNGRGGLFPLSYFDGKDQRKIEIWRQMNTYFLEKYGVEEEIL